MSSPAKVGSDERRNLEERIAQVERDQSCVRRAAALMALFTALGVAALAYGADLQDNLLSGKIGLIIKFICAVGLGSLISLVAFVGLLIAYHWKLIRLREECRLLVTGLLETHLGSPHSTHLRDHPLGESWGNTPRQTP